MQITVVVTGLTQAQARLTSLGKAFHDFRPEMKEIGHELTTYFGNDIWVSHGEDFASGPWRDLAASTLRYKGEHYPGRDMLEQSGDLKDSFYADSDKTSVFISNKSDHFIFHQNGTGFNRKAGSTSLLGALARSYSDMGGQGRGRNIPQRQMLGVTPKVESIVKNVIGAGVRTRIEAANG